MKRIIVLICLVILLPSATAEKVERSLMAGDLRTGNNETFSMDIEVDVVWGELNETRLKEVLQDVTLGYRNITLMIDDLGEYQYETEIGYYMEGEKIVVSVVEIRNESNGVIWPVPEKEEDEDEDAVFCFILGFFAVLVSVIAFTVFFYESPKAIETKAMETVIPIKPKPKPKPKPVEKKIEKVKESYEGRSLDFSHDLGDDEG